AANDDQPPPQSVARGDGEFQPLVGRKSGNHEVKILTPHWRGAEEIGIDRWVDDLARTTVALRDPSLDGSADSDKVRHARGRILVPPAQKCRHSLHQPRFDPAEAFRAEISLTLVPDIAHGREAVANMGHAAWRASALGNTVAQADNQVAGWQAPGLDCC